MFADASIEETKRKLELPSSQYIEVAGEKIHYTREGKGKSLVLLHGNGASLRSWDSCTSFLKNHFEIIRVDLPGHGLTGPNKSDDYRIENYARFLHDFVRQVGCNSFILGGHSLGGQVAWNFCLSFPEFVEGLILIGASGYPGGQKLLAIQIAKIPGINQLLRWFTPLGLVRRNLAQSYFDKSRIIESQVEIHQAGLLRLGNRRAFIIRANTPRPQNFNEIYQIACPALIIWGETDQVNPVEHAYRFKRDLKHAELAIFERAGHSVHEELPEEVSSAIRDLIEESADH